MQYVATYLVTSTPDDAAAFMTLDMKSICTWFIV